MHLALAMIGSLVASVLVGVWVGLVLLELMGMLDR